MRMAANRSAYALSTSQQRGAGAQFADGVRDRIHRAARRQQYILAEPHGLLAEPVVDRASIALFPVGQGLPWKKLLVSTGAERSLQERLGVQRRVTARRRNAFSRER